MPSIAIPESTGDAKDLKHPETHTVQPNLAAYQKPRFLAIAGY
jgi:hypothetical protein